MTNLADIFGQEDAIEQLRKSYLSDRLAHGLIFSGTTGVGKATTARALATLFLCEKPKKDKACGTCPSCRAMESAMHPDYHLITKELIRVHDKTGKSKGIDLSIQVIRPEILDKAAKKPVMGQGKVFVIEQADLMSAAAQNALLKTLEEPAGRALLILLTDQIGSLLPTVRSRCQIIRFADLDDATVLRELQKRNIPKTTATAAATLAGGSLGLAMRWINDGVIDQAKELIQRIDQIFAGSPSGDLPDWFKAAGDQYALKQLERDELGSKDQATREGLILYLRLAADHIRRRLRQASTPDDIERACNAIDAIARAERYLDANVNIALVFQQWSLALERNSIVMTT